MLGLRQIERPKQLWKEPWLCSPNWGGGGEKEGSMVVLVASSGPPARQGPLATTGSYKQLLLSCSGNHQRTEPVDAPSHLNGGSSCLLQAG